MSMDANSEEKLAHVHPELARRVRLLVSAMAAQGIEIRVVQGLRTAAEQQALFDQGRTKPGHIVTNARPFQSNHNYGLAVDFCPFKNGQPQWNDLRAFSATGKKAQSVGLEWGGAWRRFPDNPHVQLPGLSVLRCYALYKQSGLKAVWAAASLYPPKHSDGHTGELMPLPQPNINDALTVPEAVANSTSTSRYLTIIGIVVAVFGAIQSQLAALYPRYAPIVMLTGAVLAAFNERVTGGLSAAKAEVQEEGRLGRKLVRFSHTDTTQGE